MLIDANIFLEVFLKQEKSMFCKILLEKLRKGDITAHVSSFTMDAIIIALGRSGVELKTIEELFLSILNYKGIFIYIPKISDRINAFLLMKRGLDFEDALTLQCAISNNIKEIVSYDKHFDKIKNIKRLKPEEINHPSQ